MSCGIAFAATGVTAVAAMALIATGVAEAAPSPNVVGQKYSDASRALSGAGFKPVVESTVGDKTAWSDCIVTRQQDRTVQPPPNTGGSATNETLLALNCDAPVASAKAPGNSAASPEGRAAAASAAASASPSAGG
jgi:hypothetical protein